MIKKISTTMAATGALLLMTGNAQAALTELISNNGFETGDFTDWAQEVGGAQSISSTNPSSGTYSAFLSNTSPSANIIKQQNLGAGSLTAGQSVDISFDFRGVAADGGVLFVELFSLNASNGVTQSQLINGGPFFPNGDPDIWTSFSTTTTIGPDVAGGLTLLFNAPCGAAAGCISDYYIDNVSLVVDIAGAPAVPVPAAAWLFGSGLLGLAGISKRKKMK